MYCTKCGTKNSGKGLFCKHCGASLVEEALENDESDNNNDYHYPKDNKTTKSKTSNKTINKTVNKTVNKEKTQKDKKANKTTNSSEMKTEVIHKTSPFQKGMIALMVLFIIILLVALIGAGLYIFQDKTVEIPSVVGTDASQAALILENMDLNVKIRKQEVDEENKNNIVLKQNKKAGEFVAKNTRIILTVGYFKYNSLDNLVGLTLNQAKKKLNKLGLDYEIVEVESVDKENMVISQTPTAGTDYNDKTKVVLTVSKKSEPEDAKTDEESKEEQIEIESPEEE